MNISENDNALSLELAMEVYEYFRLSKNRAHEIIKEVKVAVCEWRSKAKKYGLSNREMEMKSRAFEQAED